MFWRGCYKFGMLKLIKNLNHKIDENFFNDYHQWILWTPVIFSLGVLLYFALKLYNINILCLLLLIQLLVLFFIRKKTNYALSFGVILIGFLGYFRTGYYTEKLKSPLINYRMGSGIIHGIVSDIGYYEKNGEMRKRVTVEVDKVMKFNRPMKNPPKNIRVNLSDKKYSPKYGDKIVIKANIMPNAKQLFRSSYNFERENYFKQIGGIGTNGYVEKYESGKNTIRSTLYNFRDNLSERIINATDSPSSPVIASFITGITGKIAKENINNMRYSGLAHLLAISGMHMMIIMGLFFASIRRILVSSEYLALNYNIKKISAAATLIVGFSYLCMTGFPVSAVRAFVMSALYFSGIIIDRQPDTLRFLIIAAFILIVDKPNLILNPSFQMSFMAVLGLASGFKFFREHGINFFTSNLYFKPLFYIKSILFSSLIVEVCITPIAIYHFNNYTPYNLITNFVAIPLVGFVSIPLVAISILLMPLGLEKFALIPACWTMDIVLNISKYVSNLKYGYFIFTSPDEISISFIILGLLWFLLWREKWRYFGIILFLSGVVFAIFKTTLDVIIDKEDKIVAILKNREIYFSSDKNEYKVDVIKTKMGKKDYKIISDMNFSEVFKDENIVENFIEFEKKYGVFNNDYVISVVPLR